jgi:hypothetical protein
MPKLSVWKYHCTSIGNFWVMKQCVVISLRDNTYFSENGYALYRNDTKPFSRIRTVNPENQYNKVHCLENPNLTPTLSSYLKICVWTHRSLTTRTVRTKSSCYRTRTFKTTELSSPYKHGVTNTSTSKWCNNACSALTGTKNTHNYIQHKKPSWGNTVAPARLPLLKQIGTWVCFYWPLTRCSTIPSLFHHQ